ncbi:MAG: VOC family protein [Halanaeroarchaeum sp.]
MSGIVFFTSERVDDVVSFYRSAVDAEIWLEQPGCTIVRSDEFRFGFCEGEAADTDGILTFLAPDRAGVEEYYDRLEGVATGPPTENETYDIYQFFARDPEGRTVEVQTFLHETPPLGG